MEKNIKYWDDLSQQEKDLAIAFGLENEYNHEKPNSKIENEYNHEKPNCDNENLSYEKREDVPEQAKDLWDMMHNN